MNWLLTSDLYVLPHTNYLIAPIWYSQYRFYLSILVGTCMIATLFGENYFNPIMETTTFTSSVTNSAVSDPSDTPEQDKAGGKFAGTSSKLGALETVDGEDHYVLLKKKVEEYQSGEADEEDSDEESAKEHVVMAEVDQDEKEANQSIGKAGSIKAGATI